MRGHAIVVMAIRVEDGRVEQRWVEAGRRGGGLIVARVDGGEMY